VLCHGLKPLLNKSPLLSKHTKAQKKETSTGYIKGVIQSIKQKEGKGLWVYEVAGTDTKNGKLTYGIFTHTQKLFNPGALIYAQIESGKLVEIYRVSSGQLLPVATDKVTLPKAENKPIQKRTKERQKIPAPEAETILLD
jgi:hypothetical protein